MGKIPAKYLLCQPVKLEKFYDAIKAYKNTPPGPDNEIDVKLKEVYLELIMLEYERIVQELAQQLHWGQMHPSIWDRELLDD